VFRLPRLWMWLSLATALIAAAGSVAGLLAADRIYGQETVTLADAAAAQDAVNLAIVVPLIVVLGIWASRGSVRAYVCW
jgi:asparagine N-glycosylation enzyme membrane subunit Stt3